jgi:hypothetical protein
MADKSLLESFVARQESKLRAKVAAIAQGGHMAVDHQASGAGPMRSHNQDVYDSVYDLKFSSRNGHTRGGSFHYEIIPR